MKAPREEKEKKEAFLSLDPVTAPLHSGVQQNQHLGILGHRRPACLEQMNGGGAGAGRRTKIPREKEQFRPRSGGRPDAWSSPVKCRTVAKSSRDRRFPPAAVPGFHPGPCLPCPVPPVFRPGEVRIQAESPSGPGRSQCLFQAAKVDFSSPRSHLHVLSPSTRSITETKERHSRVFSRSRASPSAVTR